MNYYYSLFNLILYNISILKILYQYILITYKIYKNSIVYMVNNMIVIKYII